MSLKEEYKLIYFILNLINEIFKSLIVKKRRNTYDCIYISIVIKESTKKS
jgi:hypothetical protein